MLRRDFCLSTIGAAACVAVLPLNLSSQVASHPSKQPPQELTRMIAEFVARTKLEDIPREVIELAKKSILDGFGLALAGSVSDAAEIVRKYVEHLGASQAHCMIAGTNLRAPAQFAALCNGVSIHINDYDDSLLVKDDVVHATVPTLPAAFAAAELPHASGRDLLLSYILGVEVECKIAEAISPQHYKEGFHATGTIGPFGGAAATAKILKLDAHQIATAFGIVAAQAAGVRVNFGTMTKSYQAGHAAESGVVAATLASLGWTAATDVLEAPRGYLTAMGGEFDPSPIVSRLGNPWSFQSPGVLIIISTQRIDFSQRQRSAAEWTFCFGRGRFGAWSGNSTHSSLRTRTTWVRHADDNLRKPTAPE